MSSTLIVVPFGLIGDTVGLVPAIDAYARKEKKDGNDTYVSVHYDGRPVLELSAAYQRGEWKFADDKGDGLPHAIVRQINLPKVANSIGHKRYLTACYFDALGMPVPEDDPRPELAVDADDPRYVWVRGKAWRADYGLAPFARSLPPQEKWSRLRWQSLVDAMPDKKFLLMGSEQRGDAPDFVTGANVEHAFDWPLASVCQLLVGLKDGLISVSTGLSHLAYAMNVRNYLLARQGPFCINPEAKKLDWKFAGDVTLEEVLELLK